MFPEKQYAEIVMYIRGRADGLGVWGYTLLIWCVFIKNCARQRPGRIHF